MFAGIDIGSRTTKLVVICDNQPVEWELLPTGVNPIGTAHKLIRGRRFHKIVATGYGRHLAGSEFADQTVTELKACAVGAHHLQAGCRTVVDVGGQDTKAISIDERGNLVDFAMNDKCAAGTGRFLEVMASALGFTIEEFGWVACEGDPSVHLNSMCVVFAESEVISLISRGADVRSIARGIHQAAVDRIVSLVRSVAPAPPAIMLAGGVARNPCIVRLLEETLRVGVTVPERAQFVAALGAGILASDSIDRLVV